MSAGWPAGRLAEGFESPVEEVGAVFGCFLGIFFFFPCLFLGKKKKIFFSN